MKKLLSMTTLLIIFIFFLSVPSFAENCQKAKSLLSEGNHYLKTSPSKAEGFYKEAANLCPKSANAYFNLGISQIAQKKRTEAEASLRKALELNPDDKEIKEALATIKKPKYPPNLVADASLYEPSGNNILDTGETGAIKITIKNTGRGDAYNVTISPSIEGSIKGLNIGRHFIIPKLEAGKVANGEIKLTTSEDDLISADVKIIISITESNGFDADPISLAFKTKELIPPDIRIADVGIDDASEDARIEPAEIVDITVRIQNRGQGIARDANAKVRLGDNVFFAGDSPREFPIGNLEPGAYKDIKFSIYTNKKATEVPVSVEFSEKRSRFDKTIPLNLAFYRPEKRTKDIIIATKDEPKPKEIEDISPLSVDTDIPPKTKIKNPYAVAVVIGNKDYRKKDIPSVDYAIRDASMIREYLIATMGFQEGNIIFQRNATYSDFASTFGTINDYKGKLYDYIKPDKSEVFIYYSGHGAPNIEDKTGYFVPVDADPAKIKLSGYAVDTFYKNLALILEERRATKLTVVIDACFSGITEKGMLIKGASPLFIEVKNPLIGIKNAIMFTSARKDQISSWYDEKRHSLFTYFFLKAIKTKVEKGDNITAGDIERFITDESEGVPYYARRLRGRNQTPEVIGEKDIELIRLK